MKKPNRIDISQNAEQSFHGKSYDDEILDVQELRELELRLKNDCLDINGGTISLKERVNRFKKSALAKFRNKVESEDCEKDKEDINNINELNTLLLKNPRILRETVTTIISVQSKLLHERNIDERRQGIEILHITNVTKLAARTFSNNPFLLLVAAAHDSFKHISNDHVELALHELASSEFGSELIVLTLENIAKKNKLRLSKTLLASIRKVSARAIYTHGNEEFPDYMSKNHVIGKTKDRMFNLFGKLYSGTKKKSTPDIFNKLNIITETIAAINACDMIVGSNLWSIDKYNLSYSITDKVNSSNFDDYLRTKLLSSFHSNLNGKSIDLFKRIDINHPITKDIDKTIDIMQFVLYLFNYKIQDSILNEKNSTSTNIHEVLNHAREIVSIFTQMKSRLKRIKLINIFRIKKIALEDDKELKRLNEKINKKFSSFIIAVDSLTKSN